MSHVGTILSHKYVCVSLRRNKSLLHWNEEPLSLFLGPIIFGVVHFLIRQKCQTVK